VVLRKLLIAHLADIEVAVSVGVGELGEDDDAVAAEVAGEVSAFHFYSLQCMADGADVSRAGQCPTFVAEDDPLFRLGAFEAK
jgi:hypothetical protein